MLYELSQNGNSYFITLTRRVSLGCAFHSASDNKMNPITY